MRFRLLIVLLFIIVILSCDKIKNRTLHFVDLSDVKLPSTELLYISWGSIYNPVKAQCDNNPLITGSGFKIDPSNASKQRILAISHEMLNDKWRLSLLKDTLKDKRFRGKIEYGDSVWVESPKDSLGNYLYPNLNGWWIVHDTKNKRYINSIDFLQTCGDDSLYNSDSLWNGKFKNIKIYKIHNYNKNIWN